MFQVKPLKILNKTILCADFSFFQDFRHFLRPCEALRQVKKQQIIVKFWMCGSSTIYYNMTCGQTKFLKSLHPIVKPSLHIWDIYFCSKKHSIFLKKVLFLSIIKTHTFCLCLCFNFFCWNHIIDFCSINYNVI